MDAGAPYTPYHPRWYRRPVSVWWWLESWRYAKFVLRELTSLAVAYFALIALWKLSAIRRGAGAYAQFFEHMKSPGFLLLNSVAFLLVVFHAITWFNLSPKAMVIRLGGKRLPDGLIVGANYGAWIALSVFLAWMTQRG